MMFHFSIDRHGPIPQFHFFQGWMVASSTGFTLQKTRILVVFNKILKELIGWSLQLLRLPGTVPAVETENFTSINLKKPEFKHQLCLFSCLTKNGSFSYV